MYSTCIFCNSSLGRNQEVEHFPVGRRLAFDAHCGRLWVVCGTCRRWNLSPLEERWEALEECERRFRGTVLRTSTEHVGLARLPDGTDLVRVGRPLRPEFAAWRYGAHFRRRQLRTGVSAAAGVVIGAGLAVAFANPLLALIGGAASHHLFRQGLADTDRYETYRAERRLRDDGGEVMLEDDRILWRMRLRPRREHGAGPWVLDVTTSLPSTEGDAVDPRTHRLTGEPALRALALRMATANQSGGSRGDVQRAVQQIERAGSPGGFLVGAEDVARKMGWGYQDVWGMPLPIRLALEMAAHEDAERRALEGEMAALERHWREAEELAAIADALPVAPAVEARLDRLRGRRGP